MINPKLKLGKTFLLLVTSHGDLLIRERFDTAAQAERTGYSKYFSYTGRDVYLHGEVPPAGGVLEFTDRSIIQFRIIPSERHT